MEGFEGTPAPWTLYNAFDEPTHVRDKELGEWYSKSTDIVTDDHRVIGHVTYQTRTGFGWPHVETLREMEANAQVMSVSPELLEALQDLWVRSTNLFGELTIDEVKASESLQSLSISIDNAKAVINKALGR